MIWNFQKKVNASDLRLLQLGVQGIEATVEKYKSFLNEVVFDMERSRESKIRIYMMQIGVLLRDINSELEWEIIKDEGKLNGVFKENNDEDPDSEESDDEEESRI